jgi:hypothetical protein
MKFDTGSTPYSTAIADLDGDGRNDLVTTNYLSQTVTILLDRSTCPMISAVTPDSGPVGGGQSVAILGAHFEGVTSVTFGGVEASISESGETDINVLAPPHTVGSVDVIVTTNSGQVILSGGYTYVANTSVPWGVRAIASTVGRVDVSWGAFPGAMSYQIDRKSGEGSYQQIGTTDANAFVDVNVSPGKAYLYRVRAVTDTAVTGNSVPDLATTFSFSDNPLPLHGTVKAIHLAELRTAVDGVRGVAGLGPASFTDAATRGTTIRAMHISELRSAIAEALAAIGIADTYTGSALTVIRRAHFQELRDRLR